MNNSDLDIEDELTAVVNAIERSHLDRDTVDQIINEVFPNEDDPVVEVTFLHRIGCKLMSLLRQLLCLTITALKLLVLIGLAFILISVHTPTQKFLLRHSQELIYPVMRQVRLWTLPLIKRYDYLSHWHVEECLLQNPFYIGSKLECWPCEDIRTIVDFTGLYNYSKVYCHNEKPFLVRDVMNQTVTFDILNQIYLDNRLALDFGTSEIKSNVFEKSLKTFHDFATSSVVRQRRDAHLTWKMNRVEAARVIRKTFIRPYFVPNTSEVALQRFIFIDGPDSNQYRLPMTEFANVWLTQGQGHRLIVLDPSETCRKNCSSVSVLLHPKDVLYYNWQFFRPRSLPARLTDELSITFMASFY